MEIKHLTEKNQGYIDELDKVSKYHSEQKTTLEVEVATLTQAVLEERTKREAMEQYKGEVQEYTHKVYEANQSVRNELIAEHQKVQTCAW